MVTARNGSVITNDSYELGWTFPSAHAEARVVKKMNYGGTVYVARVSRDGHLAMAKPCFSCMMAMKSRFVEKVFYSINDGEYGCIDLRI